jgi:hypothetical protein
MFLEDEMRKAQDEIKVFGSVPRKLAARNPVIPDTVPSVIFWIENKGDSRRVPYTMKRPFLIFSFLAIFCSCSLHPSFFIPTVSDERVEGYVTEEATKILQVAENAHKAAVYRFKLVDFPRKDILGLSLGSRRIFVSYELARLAYRQMGYRWLLRQTLAHEIAHDVLGEGSSTQEPGLNSVPGSLTHISGKDLGLPGIILFANYSRISELAADQKGLEYWQKIGWDCRIWVHLFKSFLDQGYVGDRDHPTEERLRQAVKLCPAEAS